MSYADDVYIEYYQWLTTAIFSFWMEGGLLLNLGTVYSKITYEKIWNKKYMMLYPDSSIVFFPNSFPRTPEPKCSHYVKFNDQPQNIEHATRSNVSEPVQNSSKSLKEYRQLHHWVWHRLQNHHLKILNSSQRSSMMRSMTRSRCPHRGLLEAPLPL